MTAFRPESSPLVGIVHDLPDREYHAAPGLSSTGAKRILRSPAHFQYMLTHPQEPKKAFDIGSAVHAKVLGVGAQIEVIPEDVLASNGALSTAAAKEFIANARADGKIPVKRVEANVVNKMAESVLGHPIARSLVSQPGGAPEVSVFAHDPEFDIDVRCRFDYLGGIGVDLKTSAGEATPEGFARTVATYGYDLQQVFYLDTLELVTGERPRFIFVVVENDPPYLTSVVVLDDDFVQIGKAKARRARELYARGLDTGIWAGYPNDIGIARPPMWSVYEFQDRYSEETVHA